MTKQVVAVAIFLLLLGSLFGASIYPTENFDENTYHYWTPYNIGILPAEIVGGQTGAHGYYSPTGPNFSMGDWMPDPPSGLWYNIMGDAAGDQGTTTPFMLTQEPIKSIYLPPAYTTLYNYPYRLTNPANPYYYYKLLQVAFSQGYWGNFWNSGHTSWYVGDINGGYLISTGTINLTNTAYLSFSVLKLPAGGGSGYLYVDYSATPSPAGPWTNLIDGHQIQHSSGTWVGYSETLPPVTLPNGSHNVYLRIRFRGNCTGNNPPFQPQPNYWMDDFNITDDGTPTPVELSSFTAGMSAQNYVQLTWITQTETNVSGYRIYRNDTDDFATATMLNTFIDGTNTSQMQVYVWWDEEIYEPGTYYYWLESMDFDGSNQYFGPISINVGEFQQAIPPIPITPGIANVFPNPFNPELNVQYSLDRSGPATIDIYDSRGRHLRTLFNGNAYEGTHMVTWNGTDSNGTPMGTGIYFIRMTANGKQFNSKAVLIK